MAESRVIVNRPNSSSPPPNCAICLGSCTNKCFSDSCMHQFCFKCLLEWSKIKAECPLCKQPFRRIIHNVKSNEEYDEHVVDIPTEEIHIDNEEYLVLPFGPTSHARHQFHFRTTFTVDTRGEHAIQQMLLTHPLTNGGQISIEGYTPARNVFHRRRRENNTSTSFRRSIYTRNLWVTAPPDVTGRYRDVSPSFFRSCPGARTRLVPWLNRELNALLYENTQLVMRLVDIIMDHLLRHHICSRTFRNLLYEYMDNKTDHFVHEFYNFMRSPFDMIGYDRHIIYTERPQSPAPYIDVSNSDSDVIIVSATNPEEPVVIDLVNTDSDEPILVSQEEPQVPLPIPVERFQEQENRAPVLPLKLRLKHKRQSREKEKEKKRQKKRLHRHRSSSSSSSSSTSSDNEYSKSSYERYKRRKKHRKLSKRKVSSSSSSSDLDVANTNSDGDDNLPLSAFMSRKKSLKKLKKYDRPYKNSKHPSVSSTSAKDYPRKDTDRVPQHKPEDVNQPSCSKYSSDSSPVQQPQFSRTIKSDKDRKRPEENGHRYEDSSESANLPTCSKYTYSPYASSREGSSGSNLVISRTDLDSSNDDDYPLTHLVKSEVREVKPEQKDDGPSVGDSSSNNCRLRNILIKKEEKSNTWHSYTCNYDTDSSDN